MLHKPRISLYGDRAILLQWDFNIAPENLAKLLAVKEAMEFLLNETAQEVVNSYKELLIIYKEAGALLLADFKKLEEFDFNSIEESKETGRNLELPVCYDKTFGLDLEILATTKEIDVEQLITWHTAPVYAVYFIGFLPGFPYLGGLDERLTHPRKSEPRERIAAGSVGIAGNQTGVYPQASPAGWQIIGNCPLPLFDPRRETPCLLQAGDKVSFKEISIEEHKTLEEQVKSGNFQLKNILKNG